ncbi:immunity 49 family protein [Streptomyces sp. NPDC058045]|uniref:immunity 49 family protein n=1 Tax=Streptomyces sp. NPDC058045 TaxID=3346311 RepID=UPI0036EA8B7D
MTVKVIRHGSPGPDDEGYARALGAALADTVSDLDRAPDMFNIALSEALLHVNARLAVDPSAVGIDTWEAVVGAMEVGSAVFASAAVAEGMVQCRIDHELRTIPATGLRGCSTSGNWLTAFWFAIVCRDQQRMNQLCAFPVESLRASAVDAGAQVDSHMYDWVEALQAYWMERPGLVEKLTEAINGSYPEIARVAPRDLLEKILYQPINLFHRFLRRDHEGFNEALVEALQHHKEYWTAAEDRERSVEGYLALGPLAIACLAYDAGFPVEVESEYLPQHLLRRDWLGEFPA